MQFNPVKDAHTELGDPAYFTGAVWLSAVSRPTVYPLPQVYDVQFAPGARTAWHTHPHGQTLYVKSGLGIAQKWGEDAALIHPGDSVVFAPHEKHWHGAAPQSAMGHLAIQTTDGHGVDVTWLEHVSDAQYASVDAGADDDSEGVAVVHGIYEALAAGDTARMLRLVSPDVVATQAASLPFGGEYCGHDGFAEMARRIFAVWPDFKAEPVAFTAGRGGSGVSNIMVLTRLTGTHPDAALPLDMPMVERWQVRDGLAVAVSPFYWDTSEAIRTTEESKP